MHCNFLVNRGKATAQDIEMLGEEVRKRVRETSGVDLHWEVNASGWPDAGATTLDRARPGVQRESPTPDAAGLWLSPPA